MLRSLKIDNFTVFPKAMLEYSKGMNVFIGDNGTGKSHLLKLGYALAKICSMPATTGHARHPLTKDEWQRLIATKLVSVFRPDSLGRLVSRQPGRNRCEVAVGFGRTRLEFSFATNSRAEVKLEGAVPEPTDTQPIFLPTHEVLSIFPGFAASYRQRELEFDETYYDLALALEARPLKGRPPKKIGELTRTLHELMGGQVQLEKTGRFYFVSESEGRGRLEMPLVAEGWRKVATLAHLLSNGAVRAPAEVFWDEPETNLNPRILQHVAHALVELCSIGVQVHIATHSLFLLRELEIALSNRTSLPKPMFVALERMADGSTQVNAGSSIGEVEPIAMLDADLEQTDRYLETVD